MDVYRLSVFAHIFSSVVFTGLALYWTIMLTSLSMRFDAAETARLLGIAHRSRWPHVVVPLAWRLPLPWVTTLTMVVLWLTGIINSKLRGMPEGPLWWTKMGLFLALIALQVALTRRPYPTVVRVNFALTVAMLLVSGWVIR
jgi:hypothetical protein